MMRITWCQAATFNSKPLAGAQCLLAATMQLGLEMQSVLLKHKQLPSGLYQHGIHQGMRLRIEL
jgi:hypothetical protein